MKKIIVLIVFLATCFFAWDLFADHNSGLDGYSADRGYNQASCEKMVSKETGIQAEWLGHLIGCIITNNNGYVLVAEYRVHELNKELGGKLIEEIHKLTVEPKGVEMEWIH